MKKMLNFLLLSLLATAILQAQPSLLKRDGKWILQNDKASYAIDPDKAYGLHQADFEGQRLWPSGYRMSYVIVKPEGDAWYAEDKPAPEWTGGAWQQELIRGKDRVALRATSRGPKYRMVKEYVLKQGQDDLDVSIRAEYDDYRSIHWVNCNSPFPLDKSWMRIVSQPCQGRVENRVVTFPGNPFEADKHGNFGWNHQWMELSAIGSYDPETQVGAMMLVSPATPWLIRAGVDGGKTRGKTSAYTGFSCYGMSDHGPNTGVLAFQFTIHPFKGTMPAQGDERVQRHLRELEKLDLLNRHADVGEVLPGVPGLVELWTAPADATVLRDTEAPLKHTSSIQLAAARSEVAMAQLAVRPQRNLDEVRLSSAGLKLGTQVIPLEWSRAVFTAGAPADVTRKIGRKMGGSELGLLGPVPDLLAPGHVEDCPAGQTQVFLLRATVPEQAVPGLYEGSLELMAAGRRLATVPLRLRVRSFSLATQTLTAAFDVWPCYQAYKDRELRNLMFRGAEKLILAHRGGGRWVDSPVPRWSKDGTLETVDYTAFDRSVEKALKVWQHKVVICRSFMLGYNHVPQKNLFGGPKDILTPLWTKKMMSFAHHFKQHLDEKGWAELVVLDLFDEPHPRHEHLLKAVVEKLRTVSPKFRFTYAGAYAHSLSGHIDFWNVPMSSIYTSRSVRRGIAAHGGTMTVYNPPYYSSNTILARLRGNYAWLWRENVSYVYQWVTNNWRTLEELEKDNFRPASWVLPWQRDRVASTLRLEATLLGIQDYEYFRLLEGVLPRLKASSPELAQEAEALLRRARSLTRRTPQEERCNVYCQDPTVYGRLHDDIGAFLERTLK